MNIHNQHNHPYNFPAHLQPLFDAMEAGATIKRITCMRGINNKDDRSKDFTIENFRVTEYVVSCAHDGKGKFIDAVVTDKLDEREGRAGTVISFFMDLVVDFEL